MKERITQALNVIHDNIPWQNKMTEVICILCSGEKKVG